MNSPERQTAGAVRSSHVAYFLPPDWSRVAGIATPAMERVAKDVTHTQLLIFAPDASAALALASAIAALPVAAGRRVVAATTPARAKRLLAAGPAQVVIGSPSALAPALIASVLKLEGVTSVLFAAADELDADDADLSAVMAEVPRDAARVLTALAPTPDVEALLERYMHKARRVSEDVAPVDDAPTLPSVRYQTVRGAPLEGLPLVLDETDAPSTTIVVRDPSHAPAVRALLDAVGYRDGTLATVTADVVAANPALVVLLGIPTATVWAGVVAAQPAHVVALIASRELAALRLLAGATIPLPFAARAAVLRARSSDARARAELREALAEGIPSREVIALEPLLGEYDGLEVAAAALRLLEQTRAKQAELVQAAEERVRTSMKEAQREREERQAGSDRFARPRGASERGASERGASERGAPDRGGRPERSDRPRSFTPRGDKPKGFGARGERPRGPRKDEGRGPRGPR